jgi:predicted deacylase
MTPPIIFDFSRIDFDKPGKHHYRLAFPLDSSWGYSLVPITIINGLRPPTPGAEPPGLAAFGGTHGNEWEGQIAIKQLCRQLEPESISGRILLMPQLSESACAANQRISPLDFVNMNRAFPGDPRGTISYRIADFVKQQIFPRVRIVIDLHAGGREGGFALCTSFHPVPDPVQFKEIAATAALFDTPFILIYSSKMASGLLTDEAEADGKIAIGGEFGHGEGVHRIGTRHAVEGVRNVLRRYGMLEGEVVRIDPHRSTPPRLVDARNLEDYLPCPKPGIWEPLVDLGEEVRAGQPIGHLHDFSDHSAPAHTLYACDDGVVIMMRITATCRQGETLFVVARDV